MITLKHLCREVIQAMLLIMSILLLIVVSNMFVHYLGYAVSGGMSGQAVIKLIALLLPKYFSFLIPISLFLSILLVYGKLYADNEMTILFACGMSWRRLMKITYLPAVVLAIIVAIITLFVMPKMDEFQSTVSLSSSQSNDLALITPGKFIPVEGGKQIIYISSYDKNKQTVSNVFVYRQAEEDMGPQVITAPYGYQYNDIKNNGRYVVLKDGELYEGYPGKANFRKLTFQTYAVRLGGMIVDMRKKDIESMSSWSLLKSNKLEETAELQWRLAFPFAVLVLASLGVVISRIGPRQGRYGKLIPAILLFVLYFNLMAISKSWIEQGDISPVLGIWWVHLVFLAATWLWVLYQDQVIKLPRPRRKT